MTEQETIIIEDWEQEQTTVFEDTNSAETESAEFSLEDEFTFPAYECFR